VIVVGVILLLVGWLTGVGVLWVLGIICLVVGAVLALAGGLGHQLGGRRYWY
jgi:membrane-bound ClpP family serine protease